MYFLPYVLNGYSSIYGAKNPDFAFRRNVRNDVPGVADFPGELQKLMDGSHTSDEITAFMKKVPNYAGPISIATPEFKADLENTNSNINKILAQNKSGGVFAKISLRSCRVYFYFACLFFYFRTFPRQSLLF